MNGMEKITARMEADAARSLLAVLFRKNDLLFSRAHSPLQKVLLLALSREKTERRAAQLLFAQ